MLEIRGLIWRGKNCPRLHRHSICGIRHRLEVQLNICGQPLDIPQWLVKLFSFHVQSTVSPLVSMTLDEHDIHKVDPGLEWRMIMARVGG